MIADWMKHFGGCKWLTRGGDIVQTARGDGGKVKHLFGNASHSWWSDGKRFANSEDPGDLIAPVYEWIQLPAGKAMPYLPAWACVRVDYGANRGYVGKWERVLSHINIRRIVVLRPDPNDRPVDLLKPAENIEWRPGYVPPGALSNEDIQRLMDGNSGKIVADNTPIPPMKFLDRIEQGLRFEKEMAEANAEIERLCGLNTEQAVEIDRLRNATMDRIRSYDARIALLNAEIARLMDKVKSVASVLGAKL